MYSTIKLLNKQAKRNVLECHFFKIVVCLTRKNMTNICADRLYLIKNAIVLKAKLHTSALVNIYKPLVQLIME